MILFEELIKCNNKADENWYERCRKSIDSIAMPIGGLGKFEHLLCKIAAIEKKADISINKKALLVFCADNGVVAQNVTQSDSEVTGRIATSISEGTSSAAIMAKSVGMDVYTIDIGMKEAVASTIDMHIKRGSEDITLGPAMSREDAIAAMIVGAEYMEKMANEGVDIIATGEAGIGNTTTSAAIASVLLGMDSDKMVGRGAGISDEGYENKKKAVKRAIEVNGLIHYAQNDTLDAIDVLARVGGYDIAAMAGVYLAAPLYNVPIVMDGVISATAALVAANINENITGFIIESHKSSELAMNKICEPLFLNPVIDAKMHIGEGTGAVIMLGMLDIIMNVYNDAARFNDIGVEQYEDYDNTGRR